MGAPAILLVHPSSELYGSDRVFLQTVRALRGRWPDARLTVVLPAEGVLADILREIEPDVGIEDLWVPRRARLMETLRRVPALARRIAAARRTMARYDLVYVNTMVVLDYALAARFTAAKVIIHVHEMVGGIERIVFRNLVRFSGASRVYISDAVAQQFDGALSRRARIIWNGVRALTAQPCAVSGRLNLLLIGRFNAWKGQTLLLDALARLSAEEREKLSVRLVGGVYRGGEHFRDDIVARIDALALEDCVSVHPFDAVPDEHYVWSHATVVPSTKPEPFGLVAVEAMSAGRAVIAAAHGGLAEIVVDGQTGQTFAPGDADALADCIRRYLRDPGLATAHGSAGHARFEQHFREERYQRQMVDFIERELGQRTLPAIAAA